MGQKLDVNENVTCACLCLFYACYAESCDRASAQLLLRRITPRRFYTDSCDIHGCVAEAEGVDDVDVALDSALEAFPEEELVRRDQIVSLMANFKATLARARQAESRVHIPSLL